MLALLLFQTPYGDSTSKLFQSVEVKNAFKEKKFQTPYGDSTSKPCAKFVADNKAVMEKGFRLLTEIALLNQDHKVRDGAILKFQTPYGDSTSKPYPLKMALECGLKVGFAARKLFSDNFTGFSPPKVLQMAL